MHAIIGLISVLLVEGAVVCPLAHATLGERLSSLSKDRKAFSGTLEKTSVQGSYTIHEIKGKTIQIREYVASNDLIFGSPGAEKISPTSLPFWVRMWTNIATR